MIDFLKGCKKQMTGSIKLSSQDLKDILTERFKIDFTTIIIEDSSDNAPTIEVIANQRMEELHISAHEKIQHLLPITKQTTITFKY